MSDGAVAAAGPVRTAVVLFVYDRPALTQAAVDVLRRVRPSLLYVAADGPRQDRAGDRERVAATRAVVDCVDWPGRVERWYQPANRGSNRQITEALDAVFADVDRAIVIEDDIVADPWFFPWCEAMLERYADDATVQQVSGRNELGRWDCGAHDHLVAHRGSIWGWATWRDAWQAARSTPLSPTDPYPADLDPLVREHVRQYRAMLERGESPGWDHEWTLRRIVNGGRSVVSAVNLVRNTGFGPGARYTVLAGDPRAVLDALEPATAATNPPERPDVDLRYDRWSLLFQLLASYTDPDAVRRLAKAPRVVQQAAGGDLEAVLHHLAPFRRPEESLAVVEHVRRHVGPTPLLERVADALRVAAGEPG